MRLVKTVMVVLFLLISGCMGDCNSTDPDTPPPPAPTWTPAVESTPTVVAGPLTLKPMTDGVAWFKVSRLNKLALSPKPDFRDLDVIATLPWETTSHMQLQAPGIELSIRGTSTEPCVSTTGCGKKAGLIIGVTHNILYDRKVYNENKGKPEEEVEPLYAGSRLPLSQRLALGNSSTGEDSFLLKMDLSSSLNRALFETYQGDRKIDSWVYEYRFGCPLGIGRIEEGSPYSINQRRLWWYDAFSAHGRVKVELVRQEFRDGPQTLSYPCPEL